MFARILLVLQITMPVFALIGLGKLFQVRGILTRDIRHALSWLVSMYSLPALIFLTISRASFDELINTPVIAASVGSLLLGFAIFGLLSQVMGIKGQNRAPFLYAPFWANVSYMGIPLAASAFGEDGKLIAAIINAFCMPFMVIFGTVIIHSHSPNRRASSMATKARHAFLNPLTLAAVGGVVMSLVADRFGLRDLVANSTALSAPVSVVTKVLELLGQMGLPMALLAVGASLHLSSSPRDVFQLALGCSGRLLLAPLICLGIIHVFFPDANPVHVGSCVIVMCTPNAVASYVICSGAEVAEDMASALVVWSTLLSILTIPIWTYFVI